MMAVPAELQASAQDDDSGRWSRPLRLLHLLLAIAVTAQLWVGSLMRSPHPGRADTLGFRIHEVLGFVILGLVILHWLWILTHPNEGLRHLFPWTRAQLRRVYAQLWMLVRHLQLPPGGPGGHGGAVGSPGAGGGPGSGAGSGGGSSAGSSGGGGLAGFVHGLGLLAVTAMPITGLIFYFSRLEGAGRGTLDLIENVHDTFAVIAWVYWGGHLAAALAHSVLRRPVLRDMFDLG